jgi:hypothetical protein
VEAFVSLIEGGREGEFYRDLESYFYYAQLRRCVLLSLPVVSGAVGADAGCDNSQGEASMQEYQISHSVAIEQVRPFTDAQVKPQSG